MSAAKATLQKRHPNVRIQTAGLPPLPLQLKQEAGQNPEV
jgi:hypothetical protein